MTDKTHQDSMHWVIAGALLLIGAFVAIALVMMNSQADSVSGSVTISNVSPTVVATYMTTGADYTLSDNVGPTINLTSGTTKSVKVTGTVEDLNGASDITGVSLAFYNTATTSSCTADNNNCYKVVSCTTQAGSNSNRLDFNCPLALQFYTDSSSTGGTDPSQNWVAKVGVVDTGNATGVDSSLTKEVGTLLALSIPSTLNFGTLSFNTETASGNNQDMSIQQFGNDEADVEVSMPGAMTCSTVGSIPLANVKWDLSDDDWSNVANTVLTSSPVDTDLNVGYRTDDSTILTKALHWNIKVPASGVGGTCTNTLTITAIAH